MRNTLFVASLAMALLTVQTIAVAEQIIALTVQHSLISFDSEAPGTVSTIGAITGVTAGDVLVGIDRRTQILGLPIPGPNNGRLYAVGVNTSAGTAAHLFAQRIDGRRIVGIDACGGPQRLGCAFPIHHGARNFVRS